ncbi:MAG: formimidoylglutamase [Ignavibacteria bacterium]|nr:formimidoylglutamase [Ignavibacteria bacterium]
MASQELQKLLMPIDEDLIFKSGNPDDLRLGDLITPIADVELGNATAVVILGIPQHIGVERNNGRPGAAGGPTEIRRALYKMATHSISPTMQAGKLMIIDAGNLDIAGKTLEQIHDEQHDVVAGLLRKKIFPIILGGGHDIAWPTMRALETLGEKYGVINIDAHADIRPLQDGKRAHSGSAFRQLLDVEHSHISAGGLVEFGLQEFSASKEHTSAIKAAGMHVMMLDEIRMEGIAFAWQEALGHATTSANTYISLDMDAFASAFAPGVSAPAADGFAPWEIAQCIRTAARNPALKIFDVAEMNPEYDVDGRTAKLAATMIMHVLSGIAERIKD